MNDEPKAPMPRPRRWPWLVLAGVILGIILFVVWVWFAVQHVKRIKASTEGWNRPKKTSFSCQGFGTIIGL
jgi:hypothetical protein